MKALVFFAFLLATQAHAGGLSEHDNAVHNFAHIGLGAIAGVGARVFLSHWEDAHPWLCGLGYIGAGALAQVAYRQAAHELNGPQTPERVVMGGIGGALMLSARINVKF